MRLAITTALASGLLAGVGHAQSLDIRDAAVRVVVIPEARSDIKVEMGASNPKLPLQVRQSGERTIIDGKLGRRIRGCALRGIGAKVAGLGDVPEGQMPQVVVRTPRDVKVTAGGAVFGSIGRSASVELGNAGCGDWVVANAEGMLNVQEAGSGDLRAGSAGQSKLWVAGSGNLEVGPVAGPLEVDVGGSGAVNVASVAGPLDIKIAGSGDVTVKAGKAPSMVASIAGSGDINFPGVAGSLKARVTGSGDIKVGQVTGAVSRATMGSGKVMIGGQMAVRRP